MELVDKEIVSLIISLNILVGIPSLEDYNTMRANGNYYTIEKLYHEIANSPLAIVDVGDRNTVHCDRICTGLKWRMQVVDFQADLLVLALEEWQMVLGIQWLVLVGLI